MKTKTIYCYYCCQDKVSHKNTLCLSCEQEIAEEEKIENTEKVLPMKTKTETTEYTVRFNGTTWAEKGLTRKAAIALVHSYDFNHRLFNVQNLDIVRTGIDIPIAINCGDNLVANVGDAGIKWIG